MVKANYILQPVRGGGTGDGQIFRYVPSKFEGQPGEKDFRVNLNCFLNRRALIHFAIVII
jgi:hypothetical protein